MMNDQQTILIADDTPTNLDMVANFLAECGYELQLAMNGQETLERAEKQKPDLILLDVMMPGLNGYEVCQQLKTNSGTADIPVIFMSALNTQHDKLAGFTAGAVDYLTKPLQLDEVRARVKAHLKLRGLQRQLLAKNEELQANEIRMRQSHDLLRALAAQIDAEREAERRDIARKIHEDLAQNLAALTLYVTAFIPDRQHAAAVSGMSRAIERAIQLSREMVATLRPVVLDLGIAASLRWLVRDFEKGLHLHFETFIDEDIHVDEELATFLFRAAQQLLINIALHAAATRVSFSFTRHSDHCRLLVGDNGCGFDPEKPRKENAFGHARLVEQTNRHGGSFVIDTAPERGTRVEITLPLPPELHQ